MDGSAAGLERDGAAESRSAAGSSTRAASSGRLWLGYALSVVLAAPTLLLALRRRPSLAEIRLFLAGVRDDTSELAPLLRGLRRVPAAAPELIRTVAQMRVAHGVAPPRVQIAPRSRRSPQRWNGPPIAFMHIEKTAGTSLCDVLQTLFDPGQIDPDGRRAAPPHLRPRWPPSAAGDVSRHALIWGHYDLPSLRRLDPRRFVLTLLRDPRDRLISLYAFWRAQPLGLLDAEARHDGVLAAQEMSLLDFLTCDAPALRDHTDNVYVRRFTGLYHTGTRRDPVAADKRAALERAQRACADLDFVGISEHMEPSLRLLGHRLGFQPPPRAPRLNVTAQLEAEWSEALAPVRFAARTREVEAALDARTDLDRSIYAAACRRFHAAEATARL